MTGPSQSRRSTLAALAVLALAATACKPDPAAPLGPRDAYVLLVPAEADAYKIVRNGEAGTGPLVSVLSRGFGPEQLRITYLLKQFLREGRVRGGEPFSAAARAWGNDAVPFVWGARQSGLGVGLSQDGAWLGGPVPRPGLPFVGLDAAAEDKALIQTLAGHLGRYIGTAAATAGRFDEPAAADSVLVAGYARASEVIGREWRFAEGPAGRLAPDAGTPVQRETYAGVRENRFALDELKRPLPPRQMLANPGVAATFFHRAAQDKALAGSIGPKDFYQPFASDRIPPGISPAIVLGSFGNGQAKMLGTWARAVAQGRAPAHIGDLVQLYAETFPQERQAIVRLFLATTYGATALPGGFSAAPGDTTQALATLEALTAEVLAGNRKLLAALDEDG